MSDALSIDWEEIRRRLDAMGAEIEQRFALPPEEQARILKARAHELAREPAASGPAQDALEVVEFALAGERYALPLASVREVGVLKDLTPVPGTPAIIAGIVNLRGEIHTVIDLKKFFDLPDSGISELNRVLVLAGDDLRLGILADAIHGARSLAAEELQSSLPTLTGIRAGYLRGITAERLIVLDASRIVADESILVCDEAGP